MVTVVSLRSENEKIISDKIKYAKGIYQGDSLSVMLFILALNPLSYLIKQLKGYPAGQNRNINVRHNLFF